MITILSLAALRMVLPHYSADTAISPNIFLLLCQDTLYLFKLDPQSKKKNQCIKIHRLSTTIGV